MFGVQLGVRRDRRERDFTDFYAGAAPGLRRTAYVIVRDWHVAEDLTQQAFAKLYVAWPRVRSETRLAYARRAVVNECLSHLRRHRPETPVAQPPEAATRPVDQSPDLGAALAALPDRQRAIVALRFYDDLPVAEVGRMLGISDGTVKSQTARALTTLRARLPHLDLEEIR